MIEYIILAIAFAIMVHIRYVIEVIEVIKDLRVALDIEMEVNPFSPFLFSIVFFIFSGVMMPLMFIYIMSIERERAIKDISQAIIKSYFKLEEK